MDPSRNRPIPDPAAIAVALLTAVAACGPGRTVSPSDVAKTLAEADGVEADWRLFLKPVRAQAVVLAREGRLGIYRKGKPVDDPAAAKGVVRLGPPAGSV